MIRCARSTSLGLHVLNGLFARWTCSPHPDPHGHWKIWLCYSVKRPSVCPGDHQAHGLHLQAGPASRTYPRSTSEKYRILLTDASRLLSATHFRHGLISTVPSAYRYRLPGLLGLGLLALGACRASLPDDSIFFMVAVFPPLPLRRFQCWSDWR